MNMKTEIERIDSQAKAVHDMRLEFEAEMRELDIADNNLDEEVTAEVEIKIAVAYIMKWYDACSITTKDVLTAVEDICFKHGTEYTIGVMQKMPVYPQLRRILSSGGVMRTDIQ